METERVARGRARWAHLGVIERYAIVAARGEIVRREIQRVGEHGFLDDLIVARVADVSIGRKRVRRGSLEREARLEQRTIEVVDAAPWCITVQLARPQQQLTRERGIGELHGGNRPG